AAAGAMCFVVGMLPLLGGGVLLLVGLLRKAEETAPASRGAPTPQRSGPENFAALLNNLDSQGAARLAEVFNQTPPAEAGQRPAAEPGTQAQDPGVRGSANLGRLLNQLGAKGGAEGMAEVLNSLGETGAAELGASLREMPEERVERLAEELLARSG